jgi:hypothetical protein
MTKKHFLLIVALPLSIAVTLCVLAMIPPRPGVTKANYDRIETGMTKAEVEEIFGGKEIDLLAAPMKNRSWDVFGRSVWTADDGSEAWISFGDDCVYQKRWYESAETFLDKLRRWLHLR